MDFSSAVIEYIKNILKALTMNFQVLNSVVEFLEMRARAMIL